MGMENFVTYSVFHRPLTYFQNLINKCWCDNLWMILFIACHYTEELVARKVIRLICSATSNSSSLAVSIKETHINFAKFRFSLNWCFHSRQSCQIIKTIVHFNFWAELAHMLNKHHFGLWCIAKHRTP
jgi:hypothetical protein